MGERILIIGGVATGTKAAARARRIDPSLDITLFTDEPYISYGGCGLPYFIGGIVKEKKALISYTPEDFEQKYRVRVLTRHRAIKLEPESKRVIARRLDDDTEVIFKYDRLLIATGARPLRPDLAGINLKNIYTLRNPDDGEAIRQVVQSPGIRRVVVVGAGLIGLETVENLMNYDLEVSVVEMTNQILPPLDEDFAWIVEKHIREKGVRILKSDPVKSFESAGDDHVATVVTEHNRLAADVVVLAIGTKPSVDFASHAGIQIGDHGGILVDSSMQTNIPGIFAAGDCVETIHLISGKRVPSGLGSVANRLGRVAGTNLAGGTAHFEGVLDSMIAQIFDYTVARTGLNEKEAKAQGIKFRSGVLNSTARAGYYPGGERIWMKVIAEEGSHRLLGAQAVGRGGVDKRIDVLATALTARMKCEDLINIDLSYAPPFSPALDIVNVAGQVLENIYEQNQQILSVMDVEEIRKSSPESLVLVDIRKPAERAKTGTIPDSVLIPRNELKERAPRELHHDKKIILFDTTGTSSPGACAILNKLGYSECAAMAGGILLWPYELK